MLQISYKSQTARVRVCQRQCNDGNRKIWICYTDDLNNQKKCYALRDARNGTLDAGKGKELNFSSSASFQYLEISSLVSITDF